MADPGFSRGGDVNPKVGIPTNNFFANFLHKLLEYERICTGWGSSLVSPMDRSVEINRELSLPHTGSPFPLVNNLVEEVFVVEQHYWLPLVVEVDALV